MDRTPQHDPTTPGAPHRLSAAPEPSRSGSSAERGPEVAAALTRTLTGFGAASVLGGGLLAAMSDRPTLRAFGQQNAMWGAINLAIAGVGVWRGRAHPAQADSLRRTLLINAGLDVGYISVGGHIAYHRVAFGGRLPPEAAQGHGLGVLVQGSGLLVLDLFYARRLRG
ncbi:MAG: hypothetical protein WCF36_21225 [Candidatus Nanopelagicales bacterium]